MSEQDTKSPENRRPNLNAHLALATLGVGLTAGSLSMIAASDGIGGMAMGVIATVFMRPFASAGLLNVASIATQTSKETWESIAKSKLGKNLSNPVADFVITVGGVAGALACAEPLVNVGPTAGNVAAVMGATTVFALALGFQEKVNSINHPRSRRPR